MSEMNIQRRLPGEPVSASLSASELSRELSALNKIADILQVPVADRELMLLSPGIQGERERHAHLSAKIEGLLMRKPIGDNSRMNLPAARSEIEKIIETVPSMKKRFDNAVAVNERFAASALRAYLDSGPIVMDSEPIVLPPAKSAPRP